MHCGVLVTGYNQGDWERVLRGDYDRPPTVSDAHNMDDTLAMGQGFLIKKSCEISIYGLLTAFEKMDIRLSL